ncbi:TPA: hypothetical protein HA241_01760 [Candidatus Woesearchaeota archaeon]|nr:hypothetical protein [Candidatus Woesearchaeota archaeon]HIH10891.1 hypothetical protein [Candidatus Woesearchaeota archaeon]
MCVIGAIRINGNPILFKNRDKLEPEEEYIEQTKNGHLIRSAHNHSIAAGLNKYGFAFVRAEVVNVEVIKLAYSGKVKEAVAITEREISPSTIIGLNFDQIKTVSDAVTFLKLCKEKLKASNMILADKRDIVSVEINDSEIDITETKECICKANHFHNLDFGPKNGSDYPSSYEREKQINGLVGMVNTIEKLKEILATHSNINSDYNICRHGISSTISSFIIDVTGLVWYCNSSPCKGKFRKYVLS